MGERSRAGAGTRTVGAHMVAGMDIPQSVEYNGRLYKFSSAEQAADAVNAVLAGPGEGAQAVWFDVVNAAHTPVRLVWTPGVPLTFVGEYVGE